MEKERIIAHARTGTSTFLRQAQNLVAINTTCLFLLRQFIMFLATDSEVRVRFPALPDFFLRSSGSGTGSTQPRDDN
jgi:hypothetical protein